MTRPSRQEDGAPIEPLEAKRVVLGELRAGVLEGEHGRRRALAFEAQKRLNEGGRHLGRAIANREVRALKSFTRNLQFRVLRASPENLLDKKFVHIGMVVLEPKITASAATVGDAAGANREAKPPRRSRQGEAAHVKPREEAESPWGRRASRAA